MTWLTTTEFTRYTGIAFSSDIIVNALETAEQEIIEHIFISDFYRSTNVSSAHQIFTPIMSIDGDTVIGTSDVETYEEDSFGRRYYLTTSLVSVDEYSGLVTFSSPVPTLSDTHIVIESKRGQQLFIDMLSDLKELEKLLAVNYLYEDVIHKKMSGGISQWTINGVSVAFDNTAMREIMDNNLKGIRKIYSNLRPRRWDTVKPGYAQHHGIFLIDRVDTAGARLR